MKLGAFDDLEAEAAPRQKRLEPLGQGIAGITAVNPVRRSQPNLPVSFSSTRRAPSRSCRLAGWTTTARIKPIVSTRRWRFRPMIFLPAS